MAAANAIPSSSPLVSTTIKQCILIPIRQFCPPPSYCEPSIRPRNLATRIKILSCLPTTPHAHNPPPTTKLFVSGLSFRTTEDSLRNAFKNFGNLIQVNVVMDRVANRPRGFAFLRYATEEESNKAIQGMHGKFLDGRVIFVEVAKPRSDQKSAKPKGKTGSTDTIA
ncbi:organelle RRM domain-containing protein 6, chloroplastic-like [Ipomoea triloba]|uniref:organelle RRM domain-containing protein 6, chloroplastic-like n=1 Tax=Ipomoea triloba TaxID=35885 RepID=UPI00125D0414|nr:organelle RRM domain-containing protein 6, chloroplastic-like [Ipomoea triloba]